MVTKSHTSFLLSRRRALHAFAMAAVWSAAASAQQSSPDEDPVAKSIVEKADQVRFPSEPFEVDVDVTNVVDGQVNDKRKYKILSKGNENTIVQVIEPAVDRGQIMLMRGRNLWVFLPNVSQPVRLSLSQRLTGRWQMAISLGRISPATIVRVSWEPKSSKALTAMCSS